MTGQYRALSACPVCGEPLVTTRLGCHHCGSELVGDFAPCPYCALDDAELAMLKVFLSSRGNMRELEKHLGVSYPTARARFGGLLAKLGLAETGDEEPVDTVAGEPGDATSAEAGGDATAGEESGDRGAGPAGSDSTRDEVLARVAAGDLPPDVAADLLRRLGPS